MCPTETSFITPPYEYIYIYIITRGRLYTVKVEDQLSEVSGNSMKGCTLREKIKYDYYLYHNYIRHTWIICVNNYQSMFYAL